MNKIANKQVICDVLLKHAALDKDILVVCSDSRGSGSMTNFAKGKPEQFVEVGIAEQDLVSSAPAWLPAARNRMQFHRPASYPPGAWSR